MEKPTMYGTLKRRETAVDTKIQQMMRVVEMTIFWWMSRVMNKNKERVYKEWLKRFGFDSG